MASRFRRSYPVVGFDDTPGAAQATPPLTTVAQPHEEKGRLAAEQLIDAIERGGTREPAGTLLPTELVVRGSTRPRRPSLGARENHGGDGRDVFDHVHPPRLRPSRPSQALLFEPALANLRLRRALSAATVLGAEYFERDGPLDRRAHASGDRQRDAQPPPRAGRAVLPRAGRRLVAHADGATQGHPDDGERGPLGAVRADYYGGFVRDPDGTASRPCTTASREEP
jgi:hypothetical protein